LTLKKPNRYKDTERALLDRIQQLSNQLEMCQFVTKKQRKEWLREIEELNKKLTKLRSVVNAID
jgi:hypothetical protein